VAQFVPSGAAAVGNLQRRRGVKSQFSYRKALDPVASIHAAAELLDYLNDVCRGVALGVEVILAGYNTGSCRARVSGFVHGVIKQANRLRTMSGLPPMPPPRFWWRRRTLQRQPNS
jgi:hypothetical protein